MAVPKLVERCHGLTVMRYGGLHGQRGAAMQMQHGFHGLHSTFLSHKSIQSMFALSTRLPTRTSWFNGELRTSAVVHQSVSTSRLEGASRNVSLQTPPLHGNITSQVVHSEMQLCESKPIPCTRNPSTTQSSWSNGRLFVYRPRYLSCPKSSKVPG